MGQEFPYKSFVEEDFNAFSQRLREETGELKSLFENNQLRCQKQIGGFELEAWLVDSKALPMARNVEFLERLNHPEVVPELSLFNIELNVAPLALEKDALSRFEGSLKDNWDKCREVAHQLGLDVMSIGVHPALRDEQLTLNNMSKSDRYKALNEQIIGMRNHQPIQLDISAADHLHSEHADVMLEAAATSFQIHLQVSQEDAVRAYNASQIISAPLVALSANSPFVFAKDLWDESRIPIFEQAVDIGGSGPQRVGFGERYLASSVMECFEENVDAYPVLIPVKFDSEYGRFAHLRLHNGTIWRWNRPLVGFDDQGKVHTRIENRVVAAGPTIVDMMANAAFYWGAVTAMMGDPVAAETRLPFKQCKENFYLASKYGLNSQLQWLDGECYDGASLIIDMLPIVERGLSALGVKSEDISKYLGILRDRVNSRQNGAQWQRDWVKKYGRDMQGLSQAYLERQNTQRPVHEWNI